MYFRILFQQKTFISNRVRQHSMVLRFSFIIFLLIIFSSGALALEQEPEHIIVNSQNWQDVYSGTLFANLMGVESNFLVSTRHATLLLYSISTEKESILVLSSRDLPFITGYDQILQSRGYSSPFEIREREMNIRLARELATERPEINKYIVIDGAYGYNAISVAPYASLAGFFVIFTDENNIDDVQAFLEERNPQELIIYGQVDREVKDALASLNPETINYGNRFDNNIEIVKRYLEIDATRQVILTNGEFIEKGIMSGQDPVLFLGRENVPQNVRDFISDSDIEVGILIGNELVGSATFVRRQLGINVFVKFAQGARQPEGPIAQVEDLDRFPMPRYDLLMDIVSVVYNKGTGSLEVTYKNSVDLSLFFRSTITLRDGSEIKITGDESPLFLDGDEYKTVLYRFTIDGDPLNLQAEDLSGDIFTIFGEGPKSLENSLQKSFKIEVIDVLDDAQINITDLYYDKSTEKFYIRVQNVGDVDAYVNLELIDLIVNGEEVTVGADGVVKIPAGKGVWVPISIVMSEDDFTDNPTVRVRGYFGERELALVKITEATFEIKFGGGYGKYVIYVIVLVILLLLFFLGTKKTCPSCKHKNPRGRKTCEKCGHRF